MMRNRVWRRGTFGRPKTGMNCSSILGCLSSIVALSLSKLLTLHCPTTRISCMAIWASRVATSERNGVRYVASGCIPVASVG